MFKSNPLRHHEATLRSPDLSAAGVFVFPRATEARPALPAMPETAVRQTLAAEVR